MKKWKMQWAGIGMAVLCALAVGAQTMTAAEGKNAPQVSGIEEQSLLARGCVLDQTLTYTVCGHSVERKLDAPDTVLGMNREVLAKAMEDYRITSFSAKKVEMARTLEIPCPAHWVIKADEAGILGVYRNLYGEALVCLRELGNGVNAAPEADAQALRRGLCFDTAEEAEAYIEAIES